MQHTQEIADSMRISPKKKSKMRMIGWSLEKTARGVRALVVVKFISRIINKNIRTWLLYVCKRNEPEELYRSYQRRRGDDKTKT